jgi:hypothetical protein
MTRAIYKMFVQKMDYPQIQQIQLSRNASVLVLQI